MEKKVITIELSQSQLQALIDAVEFSDSELLDEVIEQLVNESLNF